MYMTFYLTNFQWNLLLFNLGPFIYMYTLQNRYSTRKHGKQGHFYVSFKRPKKPLKIISLIGYIKMIC